MQSNDKANAATVCIECLQAYIIASISLPNISGDPKLYLYTVFIFYSKNAYFNSCVV